MSFGVPVASLIMNCKKSSLFCISSFYCFLYMDILPDYANDYDSIVCEQRDKKKV